MKIYCISIYDENYDFFKSNSLIPVGIGGGKFNNKWLNDNGKENKVYADYGIFYKATKIVDLQKNVKLMSNDGSELFTQQLFWDAESEWLFTEGQFTFKNMDYDIDAIRLDTNKEFSEFKTGKLSGSLNVTETKDSLQ